MEIDDVKRGRGRGRPVKIKSGRGRGRPRKKPEEASINMSSEQSDIENEAMEAKAKSIKQQTIVAPVEPIVIAKVAPKPEQPIIPTLTMEADISQLEAPTFTTIAPRVQESMLRLKWNHKANLIGTKREGLVIHICDVCRKPILQYGRMIPCKHVFCLKCAGTEPNKNCMRCNEPVLRIEDTANVFMCIHGGSRYSTDGCRRTYLSQRDLQAHINHRHVTQPAAVIHQQPQTQQQQQSQQHVPSDTSSLLEKRRKHSETATQSPRGPVMRPIGVGSLAPSRNLSAHSSLTQANLARINSVNEQDCQQGRASLQQTLKKATHKTSESVADASYYSSVLNSFGSSGGNAQSSANYDTTRPPPGSGNAWQSNQYYS